MADIAPSRSRTDPPAPEQTHRHHEKTHLPRRLHAHSLRDRTSSHLHRRNHRHNAKGSVQSAIELKPPISFEQLLRRDKKSPGSSRRGSVNPQQHQDEAPAAPRTETQSTPRKLVSPKEVAKIKEENRRREEELHENLKNVEEVGMRSTRQLDDTYYAILEKASLLRSIVSSIQQLADESRNMHGKFVEETTALEQNTKRNLDSFNNFDQQEQNINKFVDQLKQARANTNSLNDRLESARLRVESFEQRERDKQASYRTRWQIIWGTTIGILVLILSVALARNRRSVGQGLDVVGQQLARLGDAADEITLPLAAKLRPSPSEDPYLERLFHDV